METKETKKSYHHRIEGILSDWSARIDELKKKVDRSKAEAKIKYYEQIEALRKNLETARKKFTELKEAGEEKWEDLRKAMEDSLSDLKKSFEGFAAKFKK